jgi:hypothetical protein
MRLTRAMRSTDRALRSRRRRLGQFRTRYLVSDACFFAKKPLVTAAVGTFDGTLTTIRAHERGADGTRTRPIAACFPSRRRRHGPGLRGGRHPRRAHRRARLDDGAGSDPRDRRLRRGLVGRLLMIDARAMRFETLTMRGIRRIRFQARTPTIRTVGTAYAVITVSCATICVDLGSAAAPGQRLRYLLQVATVEAPFTTDHLFCRC